MHLVSKPTINTQKRPVLQQKCGQYGCVLRRGFCWQSCWSGTMCLRSQRRQLCWQKPCMKISCISADGLLRSAECVSLFSPGGMGKQRVQFREEPRPSGRNLLEDPELGREANESPGGCDALPSSTQPSKTSHLFDLKTKREKATSTSLPIFLGSKYTSCL